MRELCYGSVCSGIEAASISWEPLGMRPAWFAEIEPFPSAVLAHRWPHVANLGDMTKLAQKVQAEEIEAPDVLVGGTPCQAFSIAGLRGGLDDERGALTLKYVELANAIDDKRSESFLKPTVIVWENVPGVLSSADNAFGCFLAGLAGEDAPFEPGDRPESRKSNTFWRWDVKTGCHAPKWPQCGCIYGPQRKVAWRILDAQYFGVAQRRRRVFVVASARTDLDPATVLFEFEGVRRNIAPSRKKKEIASAIIANGAAISGESLNPCLHADMPPGMKSTKAVNAFRMAAFGEYIDDETASTVKARDFKDATDLAVFSSTGAGFWSEGHGTLRAREQESHEHLVTLAFPERMSGTQHAATKNTSPSLMAKNPTAVCYEVRNAEVAVRRLTPVECERLQGFPDGHTLIPTEKRKKVNSDELAYLRNHYPDLSEEEAAMLAADGPRYKAIGNSMAIPVMRWIGDRIADFGECILFWRRDSIVTSRGHITIPVLMASTITVERYPALAEIGSNSGFFRTVFSNFLNGFIPFLKSNSDTVMLVDRLIRGINRYQCKVMF